MNDIVADFKLSRVKGVLASASALKDKGLLLEKEIGLEPIYAMLSMGQKIASLASSIGMSIFELEFILQRTPQHRKQYMNAIANKLAKDSAVKLERFSEMVEMETEEVAAAKHHSAALDRSLKILNTPDAVQGSDNIVVNNTVVVRDRNDVPALPDGLEDIIEGEYSVDT